MIESYIFCRLSAVNYKENILSSFVCVHVSFVSGDVICMLHVETLWPVFVYVACMGSLVQFCWIFQVDILSSSHSLSDFDA